MCASSAVGGTLVQNTCRERHWAGEGGPAPWMSWRSLPGLMAPAADGLSPQTEVMTGIIAHPGVSIEMKMMAGGAVAHHLYHKREGTHGTVIVPLAPLQAEAMMIRSSIVYCRIRRGSEEGTEVLGGWMRTVTLPPKAALEARAVIITTVGRLATDQKKRTLYPHTLSWKRSGIAGLTRTQTATALWNLLEQRDIEPLNQPQSLSLTPALTRGPIRYKGAERRETGPETW